MSEYRRHTTTQQALKEVLKSYHLDEIHTHKPAFVESYDPDKKTISCTPPLTEYRETDAGDIKEMPWPSLDDVPVTFPGGGTAGMTYPIKKGCPVLLSFADRDIAEYMSSDGKEPIAPENYEPSPEGACFAGNRIFTEKSTPAPANEDDLILYNTEGDVVAKADKIRLGDVGCNTPLAKGSTSDSNDTTIQTKVDILAAIFGIPPIGALPSAASGVVFSND